MGVNFLFSCGHWLNQQCIEPIEHITTQIAIPKSKKGAADVNFVYFYYIAYFLPKETPNIRAS